MQGDAGAVRPGTFLETSGLSLLPGRTMMMFGRVESSKSRAVLTPTEARAATSDKGRILQVLGLSTVLAVVGMIGIYVVFFA